MPYVLIFFVPFFLYGNNFEMIQQNKEAINYKRDFFKNYALVPYKSIYSKGVIKYRNRKFKCKISQKGKLPKHWILYEKSYKIKCKKALLFRNRKISFTKWEDRLYFVESLGNHLLKKFNLINFENTIGELCIRNKCSVYYIKEEISKDFLEKHFSRKSLLLNSHLGFKKRINAHETKFEHTFMTGKKDLTWLNTGYYELYGEKSYIFKVDSLFSAIKKKNINEVKLILDVDKALRFFAVLSLFGDHSVLGDNLILYLNDKTLKVEFIGNDFLLKKNKSFSSNILFKMLIESFNDIFKKHVKNLVSQDLNEYYKNFLKQNSRYISKNDKFNMDKLLKVLLLNQKKLKSMIDMP